MSANGERLRFFRDVANITMDVNDVETVDFRALGGADTVTVNDLTGTDVQLVKSDLAGVPAGRTGDGQPDQVIVNGTNGKDAITVGGRDGTARVAGLAARVIVTNAEPANDTLTINALAGDDVVDASALRSTLGRAHAGRRRRQRRPRRERRQTTALFGREGDDVLRGGPGQDALDGGPGNNILIQN